VASCVPERGGGVRGVMKTMAVAFRTPDNERGVS
jgi:hypothetical protein